MSKYRFLYLLSIITNIVLLLCFDKTIFLITLVLQILLALFLLIFISVDATKINIDLRLDANNKQNINCHISINPNSYLIACSYLILDIKSVSKLTGFIDKKTILITLGDKNATYDISLPINVYGEQIVTIDNIWTMDFLRLFKKHLDKQYKDMIVIYPPREDVVLHLSRKSQSSFLNEGINQNSKGDDYSEIYDFKEYVPGDDIRKIHWKLSGKLDKLIVKQGTSSSNYELILIPCIGLNNSSNKEINSSLTIFSSISENLIESNVPFCVLLPIENEMKLIEVNNLNEFKNMLGMWMCSSLIDDTNKLLDYFSSENLGRHFTKALLLSTGDNSVGETIKNKTNISYVYVKDSIERQTIEDNETLIPAKLTKTTYHIFC